MSKRKRLKAQAAKNKRLQAQATVTLNAAPSSEGEAKGPPTFTVDAYNGGAIRPYSPYLDAPLVIDLAGTKAPSHKLTVLFNHDPSAIVGQTGSVDIAASSVAMSGVITGNVEDPDAPAGQIVTHARNGFEWKASIDGEIERMEFVKAGTQVTVNGQVFTGPVYVARATTLDGFSFVGTGADRTASARVAASKGESEMDFHEWSQAKGFDPEALTDEQRTLLTSTFEAEQAPPAKPAKKGNDTLDDALAPIRARRARESAITACAARLADQRPNHVEVIEATARVAINEGWDTDKFELAVWRECGPLANNQPRAGGEKAIEAKVWEAGLCMSGRLSNIEKQFDERTLEMAQRKWRSGLGLSQLLMYAAKANGVNDISTHRDVDALLRAAFVPHDRLRASSPSTFDVGGILSNVANKFIVDHFNAVDNKWRLISARRSVSDFKEITSYSLTGDLEYREVPAGGDIKHGSLGETSYSNQAKTYASMLAIDRRDLINDDLDAFQQVARKLGRGGALKLNTVFWTEFLGNDGGTFFAAGNSNVYADAAAALSLSALEYAEQLFINQTDPDGKPMAVMPSLLVVPPALKRTALRLMNSTELRQLQDSTSSGAGAATYGTSNTFQGEFTVVSTPYLSNASLTGYSTTTWYLLADPNDLPVIETCFLNGIDRPTVESAQADFDTLGIKMRGYHDFGVSLQEPRGGVRMSLS